jgi:NADPH-dependent curcumin reductase CurA
MSVTARHIVLARRPEGAPRAADFALREVPLAEPRSGEVLVRNLWLSLDPYMRLYMAGSGSIHGSVAVQLAKREGARVIASAGSTEKCAWVRELGADHAIDYRGEDLAARLAELAPEGLACAFDNVGGVQLEILIDAMAPQGRIALCGAIALYDSDNYRAGPRNLFAAIEKHVALTGFNAGFYFARAPAIIADLAAAEAEGALVNHETVIEGLAAMPQGFVDLLRGACRGKMLVRV